MAQGKFVAYYRVSTDRQGRSGLGLEAQRQDVFDHLGEGGWKVVAEHTEVESGRRADRPKLAKALETCRLHNATLIIAKLDRLARNVAFISNLMESGVEFVAVDFPQANRLTVHVLAAVAEHEREMISQRTKAALAAAKARGVRLGNPGNLTVEARRRGVALGTEARAKRARDRAALVLPVIKDIKISGICSLNGIAHALNQRGVPTARGGRWQAVQVKRVLKMAGDADQL